MLCFWVFSACVDDLGNYDYVSADGVLPVKIGGLEEEITITQGDQLQITPLVENMDKGVQYTYSWFVIETQAMSNLPRKTVIGTEKDLDFRVALKAGSYYLNLLVRDPAKDIYKRKQVMLRVEATTVNKGWYVLKDRNNETDFDYITNEGEMHADVLGGNLNQLKGNAVEMSYQVRYFHNVTVDEVTTRETFKALHVMSTEDIRTFNAADLMLLKDFPEQTYSPMECAPQSIWTGSNQGNQHLMNGGKLYSVYGMYINIGKYSGARVGTYSLFPKFLCVNFFGDVLVFDNLTNSFMACSPSGDDFVVLPTQTIAGKQVPMKNIPYTMVDAFASDADGGGAQQAFVLLKSTEKNSYSIGQVPYGFTQATVNTRMFNNLNEIPSDCLLGQSTVRCCASSGNFVYFAKDNKAYYHMNATGLAEREKLIATLPAGETISHMRYVYSGATTKIRVLAILTNTATHWKLYLYPIEAAGNPEVKAEPSAVYTGEGTGRFIMYRIS